MKKVVLMSAITAAVSLSMGLAHAGMGNDMKNGEKCVVIKDGKNLIKEGKNDCKTAVHSCAGQAKAGELDSWIYVPKGECAKINGGNMTGVSKEVKEKIEGVYSSDYIKNNDFELINRYWLTSSTPSSSVG